MLSGRFSYSPSKYLPNICHVSGIVLNTEDEMGSKGSMFPSLRGVGSVPSAITWNSDSQRVEERAYLATNLFYVSRGTGKRSVVEWFLKRIFQMILYILPGKPFTKSIVFRT